MKRITLNSVLHKGAEQLTIGFTYDPKVKEYVKKFPNVTWSQTLRAFYVPYSKHTINALYRYLRKANYFVDYSALEGNWNVSGAKQGTAKPKSDTTLSKLNEARLKDYHGHLISLRLSENTIKTYCNFVQLFLHYIKDSPLQSLNDKTVQKFVQHVLKQRNYGISSHRQLVSALKHFVLVFQDVQLDVEKLVRPKKNKRLPVVLSQEEVVDLIRVIKNIKHRAALALIYSAGLRISECINLKVADIDIDRKQVAIRMGKGRKDRYVVLAQSFLPLLHNYLDTYRPKNYFLEGQKGGKYSAVSIRNFLLRACKEVGINKKVTPHTLRHSYATHLIENGVNLRHVQELLGHAKPETTMIYTHVAKKDLLAINSPLDDAVLKLMKSDKSNRNVFLSRNLNG